MKYLIFLLSITFSFNGVSQTVIPIENYFDYDNANNVYFKDVNNTFNKFLGVWESTNGSHYFKITFYKQNKTQVGITDDGVNLRTFTQYTDRIYSHFIYKLNGATIYDTYPPAGINPTPFKSDIDGENYVVINSNKLHLNYQEPSTTGCSRNQTGILEVEFQHVGQNTDQLIWTRTDRNIGLPPYPCPSGTTPDTSEYQIPANMVLTKI
ncbi:MAG: DUF6705 family protein [Gelidibacter sp.]